MPAGEPSGTERNARANSEMRQSHDLRRVIGFFGGTALIVGITIGGGIFRNPPTIAGLVPNPLVIIGLWTAFGLISICGALAVAEDSSAMSGCLATGSIEGRSPRRTVQRRIDWGSSCCPRFSGMKKLQPAASSRCSTYGSATAKNHPHSSTRLLARGQRKRSH